MRQVVLAVTVLTAGLLLGGCSSDPYAKFNLGPARDVVAGSIDALGGLTAWEGVGKVHATAVVSYYQANGQADIDRLTRGLQPGDLIIIAARPSMGKTALALNIAENAALHRDGHHPVAVFSLEMSADALVRRMICCRAKISAHSLGKGFLARELHSELISAVDTLMKAPIVVDDTAGLEVSELRSRARQISRKHSIELIVVDYLQLLHCKEAAREGRQNEVARISSELKVMAKELHVPVVCLSQLSRAPESRDKTSGVPKLSDLRDSGAIEQDADVVCLLRRPSYYKDDPDHEDKTLAILDIAKQRNGPTGEIYLNFQADYTRFEDRIGFRREGGGGS